MEQTDTNITEFKHLSEFAKSTGRILEFNKQMYNSSRPDRYPKLYVLVEKLPVALIEKLPV